MYPRQVLSRRWFLSLSPFYLLVEGVPVWKEEEGRFQCGIELSQGAGIGAAGSLRSRGSLEICWTESLAGPAGEQTMGHKGSLKRLC